MAGSSRAKAAGIAGPRGLSLTILNRKSKSGIRNLESRFFTVPSGPSKLRDFVPAGFPAQNTIVELSARRHVNSNR